MTRRTNSRERRGWSSNRRTKVQRLGIPYTGHYADKIPYTHELARSSLHRSTRKPPLPITSVSSSGDRGMHGACGVKGGTSIDQESQYLITRINPLTSTTKERSNVRTKQSPRASLDRGGLEQGQFGGRGRAGRAQFC